MRSPRLLAVLLMAFSLASSSCRVQPDSASRHAAGDAAPEAAATQGAQASLVQAIARHLATHSQALVGSETKLVAAALVRESRRHGLEPGLVLAVIEVESHYDPFAVSEVGAVGLMQIMPSTGRALARRLGIPWRGERTLFDPVTNVILGALYLQELQERFGQLSVALAAYNWGPGHVGRQLRVGSPVPERYARRVLAAWAGSALPGARAS